MKKIKILMMVTLGLIISSSAFSRSGKGWKGFHPPGFIPTKSESGVDGFSKALTKQKDPQKPLDTSLFPGFTPTKSSSGVDGLSKTLEKLDTSLFVEHSGRLRDLEEKEGNYLEFVNVFRAELDKEKPDMKKIIEAVKEGVVDVNIKTSEGVPLLAWAMRNGHWRLKMLLLDKGALPFQPDHFGNYLEFVKIFRAELDKKQPDMKKIIEIVKKNFVDIDIRTSRGESLLGWAMRNDHWELKSLLWDKGAFIRFTQLEALLVQKGLSYFEIYEKE